MVEEREVQLCGGAEQRAIKATALELSQSRDGDVTAELHGKSEDRMWYLFRQVSMSF